MNLTAKSPSEPAYDLDNPARFPRWHEQLILMRWARPTNRWSRRLKGRLARSARLQYMGAG